MPVVRIDRFDDSRLAEYRGVSDGDLLRRSNRFVAEGRGVVGRLIESGHRVESILVNDASFRALESKLALLQAEIPVYICETDEFAAITGYNLHRGCLALAERPVVRLLAEVMSVSNRLLVLEGVSDADNVGSAFRNAAAFGACVVLDGACCDPLYRKAIRTSMGAVLQTPYARAQPWPDALRVLKAEGFELVALTPRLDAIDLCMLTRRAPQRIALMVGSEWAGLSQEAEALADIRVRIPISSDVDSLNLATATGIALHHLANP